MITKLWPILTVSLFTAPLLIGCAQEPHPLNLSLPGVPTHLDPIKASQQDAGFLVQNIFETLYRYRYLERPYRLVPELAAAQPTSSEDGLRVTIAISPGHRFSDHPAFVGGRGREVSASDVAYSLKRHLDPANESAGAWLWRDALAPPDPANPCAPICAQGSNTLVIHLKRPFPELAATLATPYAAIVPREVVEALGPDFARQPVGSGPYRLVAFDEAGAALEVNPNYHRPLLELEAEGWNPATHGATPWPSSAALPLTSRLRVNFVPDEGSRLLAFHGGKALDQIRLPASAVETFLEAGPKGEWRLKEQYRSRYAINLAPELGFVRLEFSMLDGTVGYHVDEQQQEQNRRLRCAVLGADSWALRNQLLYAGLGEVFAGIVPPAAGTEAGGWALGKATLEDYFPTLRYGAVQSPRARQEFDVFKTQLIAAGYPEEQIVLVSFARLGDLLNGIQQGQVNIYLTGWAMDYPDPINNYQLFYGPNRFPGANFSGFNDPEFDRAFEAASGLPSGPQRRVFLEKMNRRLSSACVVSSGLARRSVFVRRAGVSAFADNGPVNGVMARFAVSP